MFQKCVRDKGESIAVRLYLAVDLAGPKVFQIFQKLSFKDAVILVSICIRESCVRKFTQFV
jgi:hypothetical protein